MEGRFSKIRLKYKTQATRERCEVLGKLLKRYKDGLLKPVTHLKILIS